MKKEEFYNLLEQNNIFLNEMQKKQFDLYLFNIQETNKVMNLTSITESEEVYEKHFYDSLLFSFGENLDNKNVLDVGSGAGFPGIPLAIVYPKMKITLLEPIGKRANFLSRIKDELKLENVEVICARCEDFSSSHIEEYDIVTARAVSKLNILLELACQVIKIGGKFIALKGKIAEEEIEESKRAMEILNYKIEKIKMGELPSDESKRANVFCIKMKRVNTKYPRIYSKIKSRPL